MERWHIRRWVAWLVSTRAQVQLLHTSVSPKQDDGGHTSAAVPTWITMELGCTILIFLTDGRTCCDVCCKDGKSHTEGTSTETTPRQSTPHSSQSDDAAERAEQSVHSLAKTLGISERQTQLEFDESSAVCALRNAGWLLTRCCKTRSTGTTPFESLVQTAYPGSVREEGAILNQMNNRCLGVVEVWCDHGK